jgi:hypothetical protein
MTEIECGIEGIRVREQKVSPDRSEQKNVPTENKEKEIVPV